MVGLSSRRRRQKGSTAAPIAGISSGMQGVTQGRAPGAGQAGAMSGVTQQKDEGPYQDPTGMDVWRK